MLAHDIIIRPVVTEKTMTGMPSKKYTFEVAKNANKIEIAKAVEEVFKVKGEAYAKEIEAGIAKYVPENARAEYGNWKDYLPLVNFVTFSLDYEDEYIGCAHRHSPVMDHIISPDYSSAGFIRHKILPGVWNCVLNCHAVVDDVVTYSLKVYGADENEELHDYVQAF